ncbi:MAG TPA: FKBP-type peptidyl-prolyl cis-trans isomerase [Cyclobacteriaceae bacterium]|nr:FKBP-type peptidyl-prolyl cis-trans isomerase [Cyclobacteriaceae bacterium]
MRSNTIIIIVIAVLTWSCKGGEQETPSGYKFEFVKKGNGDVCKPGEIVVIDMAIVDQNDSTWYDNRVTDYPEMFKIAEESNKASENGITEAFRMLSAGDSILFRMKAKDFFPTVWRRPAPAGMSDDNVFTFQIKCRAVLDDAGATQFQMRTDSAHRANEAAQYEEFAKEQLTTDIGLIDNYLKSKNMTAMTLPSGLRYIIKAKGTGPTAQNGDVVVMRYAGQNLNGPEFDSGEYEFPVGQRRVIQGWDEIALIMSKGTALTVFIPSSLAYRTEGRAPVILPNAVLVFDMELLSIKK